MWEKVRISGGWKWFLSWGTLLLLPLLLYWPVIGFHFLNFDDPALLTDHPWYLAPSWQGLWQMWDPRSFWRGYSLDYSPLRDMSYLLDRVWWGWRAGAFHLTQLALHLLNTALLGLFFRRRLSPFYAWAGTLLWAVHPLCVEPLAWISSRKDLLLQAGLIGTLLLEEKGRGASAAACGLAALLSKYAAVLVGPLLALTAWLARRRVRWCLVIFLSAAALALGCLSLAVNRHLGRLQEVHLFRGETPIWPAAFQVPWHNLQAILWPAHLSAVYLPQRVFAGWLFTPVILGVAVVAGWSFLMVRIWRRGDALALGWLILGVGQLPILLQILSGHPLWLADRYLYFPLAGAALFAAALAERAGRVLPPRLIQVVLLALIALATWQSTRRLPVWRDSLALWQATAGRGSARYEAVAWGNLGLALMEAERYPEAAEALRNSLRLNPNWDRLWPGLGLSLLRSGRHQEAGQLLRQFEISASAAALAETQLERAVLQGELGQIKETETQFSAYLSVHPYDPRGWAALALHLARQGRLAEAVAAWEKALAIRPDLYAARLWRSRFLLEQGECRAAAADLLALRRAPGFYGEKVAALENLCRID